MLIIYNISRHARREKSFTRRSLREPPKSFLLKLIRYYHTLKYLKPVQVFYQLKYRLIPLRKVVGGFKNLTSRQVSKPLTFIPFIEKPVSYLGNNKFEFLNIGHSFENENIDWVLNKYGKLWTYNLNYMDYLLQPGMTKEEGLQLINEFIKSLPDNLTGLEPYPTSLRNINWIKFFSKHAVNNEGLNAVLYKQYEILSKRLEFHLLGNHLLENAFSLLFGAFYFSDKKLYDKANKLIQTELEEQILSDGGHFELSPMYHQIILDRLLDSINLLQHNKRFDGQEKLLSFFHQKATSMLGWLNNMTFQNGDIPHFNDSTNNIAPTTAQLLNYAKRLNLKIQTPISKLTSSGYRRFNGNNYECIVDVGTVGPGYIPGHAHADMLSFVLYADGKPLIIDTGISTYEKNEIRERERSTCAHNTVSVKGQNQSDVWGGFRVGKRATVNVIKDKQDVTEAEHNGYYPLIHKRAFNFSPKKLIINDCLTVPTKAVFFIHFVNSVKVKLAGDKVICNNTVTIRLKGHETFNLEQFELPQGYNKYKESTRLVIHFEKELITEIYISNEDIILN